MPHLYIPIDQNNQKDENGDGHLLKRKGPFWPLVEHPTESGIDEKDDEGEAIDSSDICHLDKREIEILGVAQIGPWKACEKERAEVF
jgi:hypothetical protein